MNLDGFLMSRDIVIAEIKDMDIIPVIDKLLPFYLKNFSDFESWLEDRAIDRHRTNSRLLKKALRLTTEEDAEIVLKVNASTITDSYWFKPRNSSLTYDNIRFKDNMFDKLALYGDPDSFNQKYKDTPELTNIGSFEKCWKKIDGEWWLYKQGNANELFSELFVYELGMALGFPMAEYELDGNYIRSRDFTKAASVNFESINGIVGENEDYEVNFNAIVELSEQAAKDYIAMIYLDTLCFNMDRHTKNYGVLRNCETGEVIGLAPNFDNNIALIARGYPTNLTREKDKLIELFITFLEGNPLALEYFENLQHPEITDSLLTDCFNRIPIEVNRSVITQFILNGKTQIQMIFEQEIKNENIQQTFGG